MKKRILTSLLLVLVLTLSVHPIITLHFCEGDLHSFTIGATNEASACCITSDVTENNYFDTLTTNLTESSDSCCSFKSVEIITDNFTVEHTNTTIQKPTTYSYFQMSTILDYLINLFSPDTIIESNSFFSTPVLYNTTLKFLAHICVYRL